MKKILLITTLCLSFAVTAYAQKIEYLTDTNSLTFSSTQVISNTAQFTLTRTGSVSIIAVGSFENRSTTLTWSQLYMTAGGYSSTLVNLGSYGGDNSGGIGATMNGSLSLRASNLAPGTYTISVTGVILNGSGILKRNISFLIIFENEDGEALARQVAAITASYQLSDSQLQALIDALTTRVTSLESAMSTAQGDISTLQGQVSSLQTSITGLQSQMTTANTNIANNTAEIESLKSQITSLKSQMAALKFKQNDDLAKSGIGLGAAGLTGLFGYANADSYSSTGSTDRIRQIISK